MSLVWWTNVTQLLYVLGKVIDFKGSNSICGILKDNAKSISKWTLLFCQMGENTALVMDTVWWLISDTKKSVCYWFLTFGLGNSSCWEMWEDNWVELWVVKISDFNGLRVKLKMLSSYIGPGEWVDTNYRGISIQSSLAKLFVSLVTITVMPSLCMVFILSRHQTNMVEFGLMPTLSNTFSLHTVFWLVFLLSL